MAKDYSQGKIYKITSDETEKIYIGSTTCELSKRLGNHNYDFKKWKKGKKRYMTSFEIIKFRDAKIELLEDYPCQNSQELLEREKEYINEYEDVVNKVAPIVTAEERAQKKHHYYKKNQKHLYKKSRQRIEKNPEKQIAYLKEYYNNNKAKLLKQQQEYAENNKEKIKQYKKEYYIKHREAIKRKTKLNVERAWLKKQQKKLNDDVYQNEQDRLLFLD